MEQTEVGFVTSVRDYLIHLEGLPSAQPNNLLMSEQGSKALVSSLSNDSLGALVINQHSPSPQESFTRVGRWHHPSHG